MATPTTNYSFSRPTVGGDTDAWGTLLNANWEQLDGLLSGANPVNGMLLTGANITATTVDLSGTVAIADASITATDVTTDVLTVTGEVTEAVGAITGTSPTIDPANGTIQTWTLSGASSPSFSLDSGQSLTLAITTGGNSVTWPAMDWVGGISPTLSATGVNFITVWKIGATVYGSYSGVAS